jgi:hypothetical protein
MHGQPIMTAIKANSLGCQKAPLRSAFCRQ